MAFFNTLEEERKRTGKYQGGVRLIDGKNGAVAGCCIGVTHSERRELGRMDVHDDQEGFLVWHGTGTARIGEETIALKPGVAIIVPAGVGHSMCCGQDSDYMETIWFLLVHLQTQLQNVIQSLHPFGRKEFYCPMKTAV